MSDNLKFFFPFNKFQTKVLSLKKTTRPLFKRFTVHGYRIARRNFCNLRASHGDMERNEVCPVKLFVITMSLLQRTSSKVNVEDYNASQVRPSPKDGTMKLLQPWFWNFVCSKANPALQLYRRDRNWPPVSHCCFTVVGGSKPPEKTKGIVDMLHGVLCQGLSKIYNWSKRQKESGKNFIKTVLLPRTNSVVFGVELRRPHPEKIYIFRQQRFRFLSRDN